MFCLLIHSSRNYSFITTQLLCVRNRKVLTSIPYLLFGTNTHILWSTPSHHLHASSAAKFLSTSWVYVYSRECLMKSNAHQNVKFIMWVIQTWYMIDFIISKMNYLNNHYSHAACNLLSILSITSSKCTFLFNFIHSVWHLKISLFLFLHFRLLNSESE
jgi:hypothetical protein